MRLAIVGLSLLIFGCGGGGGDGGSQQSTVAIPGVVLPVAPTVWTPGAESTLANVNQARSALITAYNAIDFSMQTIGQAFTSLDSMNNGDFVPVTTASTTCPNQGVLNTTVSQTPLISNARLQFGQCRSPDAIINGNLSGTRNVNGISDYQINASIASPVSDDRMFANSRLIRHEARVVTFDGITDRLSFDVTVAGISTTDGINTGGTVVVRTREPLVFRDVITTPPEGGEIIITNAANRVWRATVVQNGFEISEVNNDTAGPIEFLSWYSLVQ